MTVTLFCALVFSYLNPQDDSIFISSMFNPFKKSVAATLQFLFTFFYSYRKQAPFLRPYIWHFGFSPQSTISLRNSTSVIFLTCKQFNLFFFNQTINNTPIPFWLDFILSLFPSPSSLFLFLSHSLSLLFFILSLSLTPNFFLSFSLSSYFALFPCVRYYRQQKTLC